MGRIPADGMCLSLKKARLSRCKSRKAGEAGFEVQDLRT